MIVLSVAHSTGAHGATSADGLKEHEVSWMATLACEEALIARNLPTILMRAGQMDQACHLRKKSQAINGIYPTCAIEIHCNASSDYPDAAYSEVLHHEWSHAGKGMAHSIAGALKDGLGAHKWPCHGARGVTDLFLLNHTHCPTVIVEGVFLSNADQAKWLRDGGAMAYGQLVAEGVAGWLARTGGI